MTESKACPSLDGCIQDTEYWVDSFFLCQVAGGYRSEFWGLAITSKGLKLISDSFLEGLVVQKYSALTKT